MMIGTVFNQYSRYRLDHELAHSEEILFIALLAQINWARNEDNNLLNSNVAIGNPKLVVLTHMSTKQIHRARNSLMQRGLIEFKNGSGKKNYAIYSLGAYFRNLDINLGPDDKVSDKLNDKLNVQLNVQVNDKGSKILDPRDLDNNIYIPAPTIEKVILFWNQFQISRIPDNKEKTNAAILKALLDHGEEAVLQAIKNYAEIVNGSAYILKTRWQLSTFLDLHVEKFLDEESAKAMYRAKGGPNGRGEQRDSRDDWKERFKNPAGTHSDERDLEELLVRSETGGG